MKHGRQISRGKRLASLLKLSTGEDLDAIDKELEELEAQLKGLKALREVVAERVLNAPEPAQAPVPAKPKPPSGETPGSREKQKEQVGIWLATNAPKTIAEIGKALGIDGRMITPILLGNRDLFLRDDDGWVLTQEGRKRWGNK